MARQPKNTNTKKTENTNSGQDSSKEDKKFERARAEIKELLSGQAGDSEKSETVTKIVVTPEEEPSPAKGKKESEDTTAENFAALYRTDSDDKVDMKTIDRRDPNRKKKIIGLIIGILLILLLATLAGFYFFIQRGDKFNEEDIVINTQLPASIASGEEFTFTIEAVDNGALDIKNAELILQAPASFELRSASPSPDDEAHNTWKLNSIKSGSAKKIQITGALTADKGSSENFHLVMTYRPANFNSDFTRGSDFSLVVSGSALDLDLSVPTKVVSGKQADYKIIIINNSKEQFEHIQFTLALPDDLSVSAFDPAATKSGNVWEFDKIASKETKTISWQGAITAEEGSARELKTELGYLDAQRQYHKQNEESAIIFVVNPQLILTLSIDGSTTNNVGHFGEELEYLVKYQNDSQSVINNMIVSAELGGELFDWSSLQMPVTGEVSGGKIEWNEGSVPALKSVPPGEGGEISFKIKIKDSVVAQRPSDKNYILISKAAASSNNVVDLDGLSLEVQSNDITTKLTTRADLRVEGRYYDDQYLPVGSGPLPPEVGKTTVYKIYWYLRNNANEIKDVAVSAALPSGVNWVNDARVSAGNFSYDSTTRILSWTVNKIPPQVGQTIAELEASFSVNVTPQAGDIGQELNLLGETQLLAEDTFTSESIVKIQPAVTTDLSSDPQATGKSQVIESIDTNSNSNTNTNANANANTNTE
jgi:hypothetical protein